MKKYKRSAYMQKWKIKANRQKFRELKEYVKKNSFHYEFDKILKMEIKVMNY